MSRPYRKRRIELPPSIKNFKPCGIPRKDLQSISLSIDEYEAIRLADYKGLEHSEAAEQMEISRPTFSRLIEKSRNKIAQAIIDGKELIVEGGNVEFRNTVKRCKECGDEEIIPNNTSINNCNECGSRNVEDSASKFINNKI
ncbi:MAG: DUF134 domain-containing protein [Melioribacteraceae bacterium]|nr:DUF134 domain-containing protein [Melioribacteraceae bacterium]